MKSGASMMPNPPLWAKAAMIATVGVSIWATYWISPLYFVEQGTASKFGGFRGAAEVVQNGGYPSYVTAAIPFFFLMIVVEVFVVLWSGIPSAGAKHSIEDSWSSLAAGITQQMFVLVVRRPLALSVFPYNTLHHAVAVPLGTAMPADSVWTWILAFLAVDFCYYWLHRKCHEIGFLWAGHGVHHSSDHYNLTTALRQSWVQSLAAPVFHMPMALFFPVPVYLAVEQANLVYQFWVHTCVVRRLPWCVECVFMTPSHHRIHHDRRLHKNFGGLLIIWDRLFGSFVDETSAVYDDTHTPQEEEVALFGVLGLQDTWTEAVTQSMLWHPIAKHLTGTNGSRDLKAGVKAAWRGPGYLTAGAPRTLKPPSASAVRIRSTSRLHSVGKAYILVHFGVLVIVGFGGLVAKGLLYTHKLAIVCVLLVALYIQGLILDCNPKGRVLEALRLTVTAAAAAHSAAAAADGSYLRAGLTAAAAAHAASLLFLAAAPACFAAAAAAAAPAKAKAADSAAPGGRAAGGADPTKSLAAAAAAAEGKGYELGDGDGDSSVRARRAGPAQDN